MVSRFGVPDRTAFFAGVLEVRVVVVGLEVVLDVEVDEDIDEDVLGISDADADVDGAGVGLACPSEESPQPASPATPTRASTDDNRRVEIIMPSDRLGPDHVVVDVVLVDDLGL